MFSEVQNIFRFSITLEEVLVNLAVAMICGLTIAFFYKQTYRGPGYSTSFVNSMVLLSMITAVVIMVIGNNLARAFGLVGAMSIIRFRTAVKDTHDIVYIFFSLAIGMAAGVGFYSMAVFGTLFIGAVSLLLRQINIKSHAQREYLLQFIYQGDEVSGKTAYTEAIERHCKYHKLINVKSLGDNGELELSYYVRFRKPALSSALISELKQVAGVQHINLFFDEEFF